ncbi:LptF/LptG family permease [Bacteriovorax sp. BSW11_IV]|uniref:LptF/LptG family permease n=1 Tax=Bacteriovorax sp. BSW11_IV TaxID=1353529 RepID=UPI0005593290|nr:LptF/LptG family permease [Bacteriovorax sp. BSW11_IV]
MLKVSERYLVASFIPPFIFSTLFFVVFLLTSQLFRITRVVTKKGVEFGQVIEIVTQIAVSFLPMAIPLSAFFSIIYTLNKMSEDSEVVAMRSFGMTKFDLFKPYLIIGAFISMAVFSLNESLIPYSRTQYQNTLIKLTSKGVLIDIKPEQFFTEIPGVTLFAEHVEESGETLKNVFIKFARSRDGSEQIIMAKKGVIIKHTDDEWDVPTLRMRLIDGNIFKTTVSGKKEKVVFEKYEFPIIEGGGSIGLVTKTSMKTNSELSREIQEIEGTLKTNISEKEKDDLEGDLAKLQKEYWERFNMPVQCIVFIFLGFCLGIKQARGKGRNTSAIGLGLIILYYTLYFTGVSLSKKGVIPASAAALVPSFIVLIISVYYYRKLDWAS